MSTDYTQQLNYYALLIGPYRSMKGLKCSSNAFDSVQKKGQTRDLSIHNMRSDKTGRFEAIPAIDG